MLVPSGPLVDAHRSLDRTHYAHLSSMVAQMWNCLEDQDSLAEAALVTGSSWSLCPALRESEFLMGAMHSESLP